MKNKYLITLLQILFVFIVPLFLVIFNIVPADKRYLLLALVAILVLLIVVIEKWSLNSLGLGLKCLRQGVWQYLGLTIVSVIAVALLARFLNNNTQNILTTSHFHYIFFLVSFSQELVFRSFLIPKLRTIFKSPILIISINALIFGMMHLIYPNPVPLFILTSLMGAGFAYLYYRYPNLVLATIAHAIINFTAIFYCFASFNAICR